MISYFCIVNMPGVPAREIRVLEASDDTSAINALETVMAEWIGFSTICLYHGERLIRVRSNPDLGFPIEPLIPADTQEERKAAA
ncbi:hypothetical protein D3C87_1385060 [compost metagenome]|uniref:Uncharacterized protein n=2 Tax=Brevundimonas pondensis TaxID=2774189 RepID=A0ABX7SJ84_9CAUL|nr:hypothetical protein IFE19_09550 [Brevundimonas pondensis]